MKLGAGRPVHRRPTDADLSLRDVVDAESTRKPFHYLLADELSVILVNARQVKNLPDRKTDVSDAAWLAQLGAHHLVRASFVPPQPVRELRPRQPTGFVVRRLNPWGRPH